MHIFDALLYAPFKKLSLTFMWQLCSALQSPSLNPHDCYLQTIWKLSKRYPDKVESNPHTVLLFAHFNEWWYTDGSCISKYSKIVNFCSQTSMSTKQGGGGLYWALTVCDILFLMQIVCCPVVLAATYETTSIITQKTAIFIATVVNSIRSHLHYLMFTAVVLLCYLFTWFKPSTFITPVNWILQELVR